MLLQSLLDQQVSGGGFSRSSQVINIINLLGGRANIVDVDACMTRLRVTVKDAEKVQTEKNNGKLKGYGLVMKGQGFKLIYGPKADIIEKNLISKEKTFLIQVKLF